MCKLITVALSIVALVSLLASGCQQATPTPTATSSPKPAMTTPPTVRATPVETPSPIVKAPTVAPPVPKAPPKTISFTTWPAGTTTYVAALAMGTVLGKYADIKLAVEPAASPVLGYARMAKGEVELVYSSTSSSYCTYTGTYDHPKYDKVRDLFFSYATNQSIITRGDTGIRAVPDLKGKKVSAIYPATPIIEYYMRAILKEFGMNFDKDIVAMKHSTIVEMYDNLKERRADATFGTALRINIEEQERSPGGVYIVSIPREKILAIQKEFPFYFADTFPAGFPGSKPETVSFFGGLGVTSGADVPDDLIYMVVKTVMEHMDEIKPVHADLVDFSLANFAKYPTIPFHNGAVRYYKERGLWTKDLEDFQKNILEKRK